MRILILEDDPLIAFDLQAIVESGGHQVVGVFDTLAQARQHMAADFDFALLDIDVIDGKSFEIASTLLQKRIPFAFVSASQRTELPSHLQDAHFIPKPYREESIIRSLPAGVSHARH